MSSYLNSILNTINSLAPSYATQTPSEPATKSDSREESGDASGDASPDAFRAARGAGPQVIPLRTSQTSQPGLIAFTDNGESYDLNDTEATKQYIDKVMKKYADKAEKIAEGDTEAMDKLMQEMKDEISRAMKGDADTPPELNFKGQNFTDRDLQDANEMMGGLSKKVIADLKEKVKQLEEQANKPGIDPNADNARLRELERQARIQKWETLKQQSLVYYLKATLAGIKASQTLSASVRN